MQYTQQPDPVFFPIIVHSAAQTQLPLTAEKEIKMKKRNEETTKKMLFVVVGLSIGVPALARMIWKIWFLLAIFLIGENALNGLNIMLDKMADLDFIANLSAFFISIIEVHKAKEVKIQNVFKIMAIVAIVIIGSAIYRIFV